MIIMVCGGTGTCDADSLNGFTQEKHFVDVVLEESSQHETEAQRVTPDWASIPVLQQGQRSRHLHAAFTAAKTESTSQGDGASGSHLRWNFTAGDGQRKVLEGKRERGEDSPSCCLSFKA